MSLFCRHQWEEIGRRSVPGALESGRAFKFNGGTWSEAANDSVYGYTLIELRCSRCGDFKRRKLKGVVNASWEKHS